jgi:hypothetical protein
MKAVRLLVARNSMLGSSTLLASTSMIMPVDSSTFARSLSILTDSVIW